VGLARDLRPATVTVSPTVTVPLTVTVSPTVMLAAPAA